MAVGDTKSAVVSLTNAASYFIQPPAGEEWILHNIWHSRPLYPSLATSGGGGLFIVSSVSVMDGGNWETRLVAHLTNSVFLILNTNSAQVIGYDGIQSK